MADIHCQLDWIKKHGRHCPVGGVHEGVFPEMADRGKTTCHECWGHHPTDGVLLETEWQLPPPSASCSNGRWKTASKRYRQKWIPPLCCDSTLPYHAGSQPSITTVPEHTVPSSDLLWHQAPTWHTDMHVVKTPTQKVKWINLIKILKSNVHSKHMRPRENTISQSLGKHSEYIKMAISDEKDTAKWGQEDWGEQETKYNEGNQRGSG